MPSASSPRRSEPSSRIPRSALRSGFPLVWLIGNAKNGISSCELARALGVTQKTAWFMLHRIRKAMQNGSIMKLGGLDSSGVEVDETFIGGKARNMHLSKRQRRITGTGTKDKVAVMGILERGGQVRTIVVAKPQESLSARLKFASTSKLEPLSIPTSCSPMTALHPTTRIKSWIMRSNMSTVRFIPMALRTSGAC